MFADQAKIYVRSGKGGDGHVSFRREKYVTNGGPDGGDGGKGGDVWLEIDDGSNTLIDFRNVRKYCAQHGEDGGKRNCRGKDGESITLKVPEGTVVREAESGKVIVDMSGDTRRFLLLKGGRGGNGNQHYATSTMQAPKYAQPGQPAQELEVVLELKCIADVGLVGFPNVGKSTLLSHVSNAKPKIANYHFTTLDPHLGVVEIGSYSFVMADIPGLIEGASEGVGLGHDFLRHIDRTKVLIHVVDAAGTEGRDPLEDLAAIREELRKYDPELLERPQILAANKMDVLGDEERDQVLQKLQDAIPQYGISAVYPISAATGEGLQDLLYEVGRVLSEIKTPAKIYEQEYDPQVMLAFSEDPYTVYFDEEEDEYVIEGPRIEKMLGYTNLDSEKGFAFFQRFLKDNGMLEQLEALGIKDGDTVRLYGHSFEYYK
ncbi:MAG: GTPase ObgE [Lachnospiraceae bacterium]|nr:GTPase ObgE [Lachnospiraceae bacterium]